MAGSVVVVGSINCDSYVEVSEHPKPGETILGLDSSRSSGGKGANQAAAATIFGAPVGMLGAVGQDDDGEFVVGELGKREVDTSHVAVVGEPTGRALVTVDSYGENTVIVLPGANATVTPSSLADRETIIAGADVVVTQGEIPADTIEWLAGVVTGRLVCNLAPVVEVSEETLARFDPLIVNEHEAKDLLRQLGRDGEVSQGGEAEQIGWELVERLSELELPSIVVTLGDEGAIWADHTGRAHVPSVPVKAVDTTGAGDCFVGVLAGALADGQSLAEATKLAARAGAFACQAMGAQPSYPKSLADLEAL